MRTVEGAHGKLHQAGWTLVVSEMGGRLCEMLHLALSKPCLRWTDHEEPKHDLVNSSFFILFYMPSVPVGY